MGYCGIPSRGCYSCRAKKTRCDQIPLPDGCGQCATAKRNCPGYRAPGELVFRDQSTSVARKVKAREAKAKQRRKQDSVPASIPGENSAVGPQQSPETVKWQQRRQQQLQQPSLGITLMPTIEERATGLFVTNYVLCARGPSRGHLECIADLERTQRIGECLTSSMIAVGLASYAHAAKAPSLMDNARRQYVKAIQLTNEALKSPKGVKDDSTLVAIMVLGIFETITGSKPALLKNWADHVNGAAAVVKLRGREQLQSPASRRITIQASSDLAATCIHRGIAVPECIGELMAEVREIDINPDPPFTVVEMLIKYASFNASIRRGSCSDPKVIIDKALEMDGVLSDLFTGIPEWEYTTVSTNVASDMVYNGRYHVYYDPWVARVWNAMRTVRILLHEKIRDALRSGFSSKPPLFYRSEHTVQFQTSTDICYKLQADILATVPQHLSLFSRPEASSEDFPTAKALGPKPRDHMNDILSVPMSNGCFLVWPLWFAGVMDVTTEPIRQFVVKNLKFIGHEMGINKALVLATMIEPNAAQSDDQILAEKIARINVAVNDYFGINTLANPVKLTVATTSN